uniref:Putative secreted protein n=1 Tax=Anopheles marajoara TaxID=58244 RepID=A0A2M4CDX8_9DIPT
MYSFPAVALVWVKLTDTGCASVPWSRTVTFLVDPTMTVTSCGAICSRSVPLFWPSVGPTTVKHNRRRVTNGA